MHTMKIAKAEAKLGSEDRYRIVADGWKFGITFNGKVVIHGMERKEAEDLLPILNSVIEEASHM